VKAGYIAIIGILILLALVFEYCLFFYQWGADARTGNAIQSAAVFVALLAAVIALSAADPKAKKVKVKIHRTVDPKDASFYPKSALPVELLARFQAFTDPITSHRVQFKIENTSGFTLKKPMLTFRLPLEKQHPHEVSGRYVLPRFCTEV
jgi:hypothetical protein